MKDWMIQCLDDDEDLFQVYSGATPERAALSYCLAMVESTLVVRARLLTDDLPVDRWGRELMVKRDDDIVIEVDIAAATKRR